MTITPTMALIASFLTPSVLLSGTAYYLNTEYVAVIDGPFLTVKEFKLSGAEQTIQRIQTEIDDLEDAIQYGTCGSVEDCAAAERKVKRLKRDLQKWQTTLQNIKDGRQTA